MFAEFRKRTPLALLILTVSAVFFVSCGELEKTEPDTFFSETKPPREQIFRWSNGKFPKSFDPAMASAPPETDIVRAVYDGLTETNPNTLDAIPAVAINWKPDSTNKVWRFELRKDVYWSNGEKVTAKDFVRSWNRVAGLGEKAPHHFLLHNFEGVHSKVDSGKKIKTAENESVNSNVTSTNSSNPATNSNSASQAKAAQKPAPTPKDKLAVRAISDHELEVKLIEPDDELPKLLAHPMFRPVYGDGKGFETDPVNADIVTNGAFRIASVGKDGVTLDRREKYHDRKRIQLARVVFVPSENADSALALYKQGKVDVVTNSSIEPLAKKILSPYNDFRQTTHSALNLYEFNLKSAPFNDRRVRESLAMAIDREEIVKGVLEDSAKPAYDFLPFKSERAKPISADSKAAKKLLEKAGFGENNRFPTIKLLINRNDTQKKVAERVAKMWKEVLDVDTEVVVTETKEMEQIKAKGEYSLIRRGVVLPTSDETANMLALFGSDEDSIAERSETSESEKNESEVVPSDSDEVLSINTGVEDKAVLTEEEAIAEIPAIPLYFPTSYSLVKPYVEGFVLNTLDAPLLKDVKIDSNWSPKKDEDKKG